MLSRHRKTLVALAAVLVVVVVGAGAAIGATGALSPKQESEAVIDDAAEQLGVEPSELTDALKTALKNRVDAAVKAGRLTEAQGQALKARIDAGDMPLLGLGGPGLHHHGPHGLLGGLDAAAEYLGMPEANLRSALVDGKTLAQVAKSRGKSVSGLVDALVADAKAKLADAVEDGRLTQAQSRALQGELEARVTEMVNRTPPARLERRFDGAPGGPFGAPPEESVAPSGAAA
jgi:hypothetical protein